MSMSTTQTSPRVITCIRPRCAAYQVMMRYEPGSKLLLTCTRRGRVQLWELYLDGDVERPRKLDAEGAAYHLDRAIAAGYDVVQITTELEQRARRRRSARAR